MPIAEHDTAPFFSLDGRRACVIVSAAILVAYVAVSFDIGRRRCGRGGLPGCAASQISFPF
jgi:hypothetical protein